VPNAERLRIARRRGKEGFTVDFAAVTSVNALCLTVATQGARVVGAQAVAIAVSPNAMWLTVARRVSCVGRAAAAGWKWQIRIPASQRRVPRASRLGVASRRGGVVGTVIDAGTILVNALCLSVASRGSGVRRADAGGGGSARSARTLRSNSWRARLGWHWWDWCRHC